jgi:hypothetical protein
MTDEDKEVTWAVYKNSSGTYSMLTIDDVCPLQEEEEAVYFGPFKQAQDLKIRLNSLLRS